LCESYRSKIKQLLPLYLHLFDDSEMEVRLAAVSRLPDVARLHNDQAFYKEVICIVERLAVQPAENVRAAVGNVLPALAPLFGTQLTAQLMKTFLILIRDDFAEVRLKLINTVASFALVIGSDMLKQSLLPAILELAEDKAWRVRGSVIDIVPLFADLGIDFFCKEMQEPYDNWFADSVNSVRQWAANSMKALIEVLGAGQCIAFILPILRKHAAGDFYLRRISVLHALAILGENLGDRDVGDHLVPLFEELVQDPVPNVRFTCARAIKKIGLVHHDTVTRGKCVNILNRLANEKESDVDVKYFALESLHALQ